MSIALRAAAVAESRCRISSGSRLLDAGTCPVTWQGICPGPCLWPCQRDVPGSVSWGVSGAVPGGVPGAASGDVPGTSLGARQGARTILDRAQEAQRSLNVLGQLKWEGLGEQRLDVGGLQLRQGAGGMHLGRSCHAPLSGPKILEPTRTGCTWDSPGMHHRLDLDRASSTGHARNAPGTVLGRTAVWIWEAPSSSGDALNAGVLPGSSRRERVTPQGGILL